MVSDQVTFASPSSFDIDEAALVKEIADGGHGDKLVELVRAADLGISDIEAGWAWEAASPTMQRRMARIFPGPERVSVKSGFITNQPAISQPRRVPVRSTVVIQRSRDECEHPVGNQPTDEELDDFIRGMLRRLHEKSGTFEM